MGNIYSMDESLAQYKQDIFSLSLNGKNSIIGRSVVVHKNEDDYETVPCGNAGKVIAAGVIGISSSQ
jgi:Cu-Zn family superoxide dismutase